MGTGAGRERPWGAIVAGAFLLGGAAFLAWRPVESWIAGPLGRSYCREIIRCDPHYTYEECVHDIAVDTLDGRPVREGCTPCLRREGCARALHCFECGFDGR